MRVLTVRQPWAWAIIHGGKDVENRPRNLAGDYRGPVAIHAGLTGASFDARHPELWPFDRSRHTFGAIIGVVDLIDSHDAADCWRRPWKYDEEGWCSPWAERDVRHLVLREARPLSEPIPFKGGLGLRTLSVEVEAEVLRRLA